MRQVVRACRESDAADLYAMDIALTVDGRGQVRVLSDLPDAARHASRVATRLHDVDAWLVVDLDGRVVAAGSVKRLGPALCRHVGAFEIAVHPDSQGRGLGRLLSEALVAASDTLGIERLELFVRSDNHRAIGLYESLGFTRESVRTGFVKLLDGTLLDDYAMVRFAGALDQGLRQ